MEREINPLVTVVIPSYNRRDLLCRALNSVASQTYKKLEVIVVDDGSTDGTDEMIRSLSHYPLPIRYVAQQNRGPAAARNKALDLASGTFIGLLDSDDIWLPTKIERQIEYLNAQQVDFVYCNGFVIDENGRRDEEQTNKLRPKKLYSPEEFLLSEVRFFTSGVLFHRKCLENAGRFDENLLFFEDLDLWFRILLSHKAGFVDEELVIKSRHALNLEFTQPSVTSSRCAWIARKKQVSIFEKNIRPLEPAEKEKALYLFQLDLIKESIATGARSDARAEIASYMKTHPKFAPGVFYFLLTLVPGGLVPRIIWNRRRRLAQTKS
jgi:glycosyltransferase involved in cell wall biosynthesis